MTPERSRERREAAATTETGPVADESESLGAPARVAAAAHPQPPRRPRGRHRARRHRDRLARRAPGRRALRDTHRRGRRGAAAGDDRRLRACGTRSATPGTAPASAPASSPAPTSPCSPALTWLAERVPARRREPVERRGDHRLAALPRPGASRVVRLPRRSRRHLVAGRPGRSPPWPGARAPSSPPRPRDGRVTLAVVHVLLPFVLAGLTLAARRDGTFTATFATALAAAVLGAFAPPLLVVVLLAALRAPRRRPRHGAGARARAARRARRRCSVRGSRASSRTGGCCCRAPACSPPATGPGAWPLLLTQPGRGHDDDVAAGARRRARPRRVCRPRPEPRRVRRSRGRRRARARRTRRRPRLGAGRARLGRDGRRAVGSRPTSGPASGSSCGSPACSSGVLAGSAPVLAALRGPRRRWAFAAAVAVVAVLVAAVVSGAAVWAVQGVGRHPVRRPGDPAGRGGRAGQRPARQPPAAAAALRRGRRLRPRRSGAGRAAARPRPRSPTPTTTPLVGAVANIVGGRGADSLDSIALARLGIGFVQVRATADSTLARRLDSSEGLSRLGTSEQGILWKVQPLPGGRRRARRDRAVAGPPRRRRRRPARGRAHGRPARRGRHDAAGRHRRPAPRRRRARASGPTRRS